MNTFLQKHSPSVTGVLSGFDRVIFRGYLRRLTQAFYMLGFLSLRKIPLKDFGEFAERCSDGVKAAAHKIATDAGRQVIHLYSAVERKDQMAREIAERDKIEEGLIVVFSALESCLSFQVFGRAKEGRLGLKQAQRKCLHLYYYVQHPQMGLMHFRLQTWFPFTLQVYVNGREWLARTLKQHQIPFVKQGNCFTQLADLPQAQALFDEQLKMDWNGFLQSLVKTYHPTLPEILQDYTIDYHWSAAATEWATDVMFKDAATLARLYPRLTRHAITTFDTASVLRFMGGRVYKNDQAHGLLAGPVNSGLKRFPDCVRVRHAARGNALKVYNKEGTVMRVETNLAHPQVFKVCRSKEGEPNGKKEWLPMRQGVVDLPHRAEVSQACNERYLEGLAAVDHTQSLGELLQECNPRVKLGNKHLRGLQPTGQDMQLLQTIANGDYQISGLRNVDLRKRLFETPTDDLKERRRRSAQVTRKLRLLRAHGLLEKIPKTHRYQLTTKGCRLATALAAANKVTASKVMELAA